MLDIQSSAVSDELGRANCKCEGITKACLDNTQSTTSERHHNLVKAVVLIVPLQQPLVSGQNVVAIKICRK